MLACAFRHRGDRVSAFIELFFIIVIIVIVFGFRSIPALGEAIGRLLHRHAKRPSAPRSDTTADETAAAGTAGPEGPRET